MRKRNLLACVKISNCFWKRHTVAKIDAHWAPSGNLRVFFSSKISWKRFSFYLKNYEEIRTSSLGQRSTPRRVSMTCWILFQSSLSSLSISKYSSVWNTMDRYPSSLSQRLKRCRIQHNATQILFFDFLWNINIINEYEGRMVGDTLSLLPFTFLDSMWTRLRPSSSNTLRALESPTMPLKVMEVDLLRRIMEHLTF